jgi:hypothetical protein
MAWVDGLSRGRRTRFAWCQSTKSLESRDSQNERSSASEENLGMGFRLLRINHAFLSMHVTSGDDADQCSLPAKCENYMQPPAIGCSPECMIAGLSLAVPRIRGNDQRIIEKDGFRFRPGNVVLFDAFARVSFVPVESFHSIWFNHPCILSKYTSQGNLSSRLFRVTKNLEFRAISGLIGHNPNRRRRGGILFGCALVLLGEATTRGPRKLATALEPMGCETSEIV